MKTGLTTLTRGSRRRRPQRGAFWALVLSATIALTGCSAADDAVSTSAAGGISAQHQGACEVSVLAVGDSLASGGPWDATAGDPGSWTYFLSEGVEIIGGWRRDGATSAMIAENIPQESAQVLAIMAGTNDVRKSEPLHELADHLLAAVERVDVDTVIISAIPPEPVYAERVTIANAIIRDLAAQQGWVWIDAWESSRDGDGWTEGSTADGVHGSLTANRSAAEAFLSAITMTAQL